MMIIIRTVFVAGFLGLDIPEIKEFVVSSEDCEKAKSHEGKLVAIF